MNDTAVETTSDDLEFSTFYVGWGRCAELTFLNIQEINKHFEITKVPQAADYIEGILNLRGHIVTIIDLGKKLGLDPVTQDKDNRNIIVNSEEEAHPTAGGRHLRRCLGPERRHRACHPPISAVLRGKYFQGVLKTENQLIGILDIDEVLKE